MTVRNELAEFRKIWGGFWAPRVVMTANNLEIFENLKEAKTAEEAAQSVGASLRGATILLDALAAMGLLRKKGNRYSNSPAARKFLLRESPYYQGDMLHHADVLWKSWSSLDEIVKSGRPAEAESRDHRSFIMAMHNNSVVKAKPVLQTVGLKGVRRALDLAGGPGTYSIEMARKGIDVTLFDLPETIPIARELAEKAGVMVNFIAGDILNDSPGEGYDLIFVSQLLHAFSPEENLEILRRCRNALAPGGRVAVQEFYIDRNLASPVPGALFAVNMLVNTGGGRCYPPSEIAALMRKAGLRETAEKRVEESVVVIGRVR
jgi:2-polyprenyl-3-methyl-5-hydroxy-6-metoxy-1,4-benzoquinol methylase